MNSDIDPQVPDDQKPRKPWEARDWVALVLAVSVGIVPLAAIVGHLLKEPLTEERVQILAGVIVAIIAILSHYMGAHEAKK